MRLKNRIDVALISTKPEEIVDIGETGGRPDAQLVIKLDGGGSVTVQGAEELNGEFADVATVTVPEDGVYRASIPAECPRYIRLAAAGATLSVRI